MRSPTAYEAMPVPPFAAGNVPETVVVRLILPHEGAVATPFEISALPLATAGRAAREVGPDA